MMYGKNSRLKLAILDGDEGFAWKLAEYMNARSGFPLEAAAFTKTELFTESVKETGVDVLLMDADLLGEPGGEAAAALAALCLLLEGKGGDGRPEGVPYRVLDRYRAADELIDEILGICADARSPGEANGSGAARGAGTASGPGDGHVSGTASGSGEGRGPETRHGPGKPGYGRSGRDHSLTCEPDDALQALPCRDMPKGSELISVYSPVGRCGKTAFALALGEILAEEKRVIYLNLERYSGFRGLGIMQEASGDISDLVYYCRMDQDSLVYRLGSLVRTFRSLDYIAPAIAGEDVMGVPAGEWMGVFAALAAAGEYDVVLLDLGISIEDSIPLLEKSSVIYMPVLRERASEAKTEQFFEAAARLGAGSVRERVKTLILPAPREELWGKDASARLSRGRMGNFVRKLL